MPFLSKLEVEYIDGENWILTAPLVYQTTGGDTWEVPEHFVTDYASIPRLLWTLVGDPDSCGPAAVLHDYLYRTGIVSRAEADRLFYEALGDLGMRASKRYVMWLALRAAGWTAYRPSVQKVS